jgi:D-alanyl-D-alanine carboxypeptidase
MKISSLKSLVSLSLMAISAGLISCKKNSNESKDYEKIDIHNLLTDILAKENRSGATGIPLTLQCSGYFSSNPKTFNIGLQRKNGEIVTDQSLFQIGSNSKVFLSVVMLQLEKEGRLSIEDPVSKFLNDKYPLWQNIKIKNILNMTSGIPNYTGEKEVMGDILKLFKLNPKKNTTSEEILDSVKNKPLLDQTKNKYSYSNKNYVLAAEIIKSITGKDISEEILDRIIKRLKLENTFYIKTFPNENVHFPKYLMSGYYYESNEIYRIFDNGTDIIDFSMSWGDAAGSITSNSLDLNTFLRSLFTGKLLDTEQLKKLTTLVDQDTGEILINGVNENNKSGYGLGIAARYNSILKDIEYVHGGGTFGFKSLIKYFPSKNATYITAFNSIGVQRENSDSFYENIEKYIVQNCK